VELAQATPGGQQVAALMSSGYERIHQMMVQVWLNQANGDPNWLRIPALSQKLIKSL
jgi:hypothetical protein